MEFEGWYGNNISASFSMHKYTHGVRSAPMQEVGSRSSPGPHPVTSLKQLPHDPLLPASNYTIAVWCAPVGPNPNVIYLKYSLCVQEFTIFTDNLGQLVLEKTFLAIKPHI